MTARGQDENSPFSALCQLPPGADIGPGSRPACQARDAWRHDFGRDFGTNIVVVPSVGPAAPYDGVPPPDYGVPPMAYYGLSPCYGQRGTILHRQVDTPNGLVSQPVFVC